MSIKERIIEQSMAMFASQGIKSVRMDDIATTLGISKRTIYELFGDKEYLIETAVMYFFHKKEEHDNACAAQAGSLIEELIIRMNADEDAVQKGLAMMADLRKFYPAIHAKVTEEAHEAGIHKMRELIARGIGEGVFIPQIDADMAIGMFIDLVSGILERKNPVVPRHDVPLSEVLRFCMIFFVRGIATVKGIEQIDNYLKVKYLLKE